MNREPVVTAAGIAGLIGAFIVFLRMMGWLSFNDDQQSALMNVVNLALPFLIPVIAGVIARKYVTPVADPRNNAGERLVPESKRDID